MVGLTGSTVSNSVGGRALTAAFVAAPATVTRAAIIRADHMSLLGACQWLAQTRGSIALHESTYMYPLVESVHVLTLCLFVGMSVLFDLRLLGLVLPQVRASSVSARLNPWIFQVGIRRRTAEWDLQPTPPRAARMAGMASLALWAVIIVAGRMIAYSWFDCDKQPQSDFVNWATGCTVEEPID